MSPRRKLLLAGLSALVLCGVQACTGEAELNPQPLPPEGTPAAGSDNGSERGGDSPAAPPNPMDAADAGPADGDASDADGGDR